MSARRKAWRNLMVSAINAGLEQGVFSLTPGNDREAAVLYRFSLLDRPALGRACGISHDELSIHACFLPTPDGERWIAAYGARFLAGEAVACGWLERRTGTYLQTTNGRPYLCCRAPYLEMLAAANVTPQGYADHGKFFL